MAGLVEMLRTGVTGMEAKKGRLKDEAGVKHWIVWKRKLLGLRESLVGKEMGRSRKSMSGHDKCMCVHV